MEQQNNTIEILLSPESATQTLENNIEQQNNTIEILLSPESATQTLENNNNYLKLNNNDLNIIISSAEDIILNSNLTESFSVLSSVKNTENNTFSKINTVNTFQDLNNTTLDSVDKLIINSTDSISKLE